MITLLVRYGSSGSTMSKVLLIIVIAMVVAFTVFALAILFQHAVHARSRFSRETESRSEIPTG